MAVIVTRIDNVTAVTAITFGGADGYEIEFGILNITQSGRPRASFREWREVVIADADEVDDVLKVIETAAKETPAGNRHGG